MVDVVIAVKDLVTYFFTEAGVVRVQAGGEVNVLLAMRQGAGVPGLPDVRPGADDRDQPRLAGAQNRGSWPPHPFPATVLSQL
jgi:hypothetical protein